MPNCFSLTRKGEKEPRELYKIDDDLWFLFTGAIPKPNDRWYKNWYNIIGLRLACGHSLKEIADEMREEEDELADVAEFLYTNYISNSWYSRR